MQFIEFTRRLATSSNTPTPALSVRLQLPNRLMVLKGIRLGHTPGHVFKHVRFYPQVNHKHHDAQRPIIIITSWPYPAASTAQAPPTRKEWRLMDEGSTPTTAALLFKSAEMTLGLIVLDSEVEDR